MNIENFPLAWRWTSETHKVLPPEILQSLRPVGTETARSLFANAPANLGPGAIIHDATDTAATQEWLNSLPVSGSEVTLVWDAETALKLPWSTFVRYWSDFCYPSSDDVTIFLEPQENALLWHHYEVFEFKVGAF